MSPKEGGRRSNKHKGVEGKEEEEDSRLLPRPLRFLPFLLKERREKSGESGAVIEYHAAAGRRERRKEGERESERRTKEEREERRMPPFIPTFFLFSGTAEGKKPEKGVERVRKEERREEEALTDMGERDRGMEEGGGKVRLFGY